MAISDPTMSVPTPTGILQGVAAFNWDGTTWQPAGRAGPSVPTPTGNLQGVAAFTGGPSWAPAGRAGPGVATPTGVLDGVAVYTWSGSQWTPPGGTETVPTPTGGLRGVAAFDWDGTAWQPAAQAGSSVPTPYGVLDGVARFGWTGSAWAAVGAPSFQRDFLSGSLGAGAVFTRASTGTYTNASGVLVSATNDAPRFDYDPATLQPKGLLLEDTSTNIWLQSANAAAWGTLNNISVAPTVTANQVAAPDGTVTASRVVYPAVSTAGAYSIVYQGATTTAAVHAVSIWLRGNVGGEQVYIGVLTGVGSTPRITLTTQWRRYTYITPTLTAAGNFFMVGTDLRDTNQAATSAQTIYAWGGQIEAIGYVTSYISTVGAAVTRAADVLSYPTTAIPGFSATAMTVVCEADLLATPGVTGVLIASDGTTNNRVQFAAFGGSLFTTVTAGGVNGVANPEAASTVAIGNVWKFGGSLIAGQYRSALNGVPTASVTTGVVMPTGINSIALGNLASAGGFYLGGHMRRFSYWPRALSQAELTSVTS